MLEKYLSNEGYQVTVATTGAAALSAASATEPELVLLELDAVLAEPGCFGPDEPFMSSTTTTATTMAAPSRRTHGRRRNGLPARDSRTLSFRSLKTSPSHAIGLGPAYGSEGGAMRQGWRNSWPVRRTFPASSR